MGMLYYSDDEIQGQMCRFIHPSEVYILLYIIINKII